VINRQLSTYRNPSALASSRRVAAKKKRSGDRPQAGIRAFQRNGSARSGIVEA
jgi:hypothetical protein